MPRIERNIAIEELLERHPDSVKFLNERNLPCLVCGEPSWGTLEELARDKQWDDAAIEKLVQDMNNKLVAQRAS